MFFIKKSEFSVVYIDIFVKCKGVLSLIHENSLYLSLFL